MKKPTVPTLTVLAIAFALALSGCNTVAGIGKDVQRAGQAVQGASGH